MRRTEADQGWGSVLGEKPRVISGHKRKECFTTVSSVLSGRSCGVGFFSVVPMSTARIFGMM